MGRITTKTGDGGRTKLFGGEEVVKNSDFIELLGELDELQATIALARHGGEENEGLHQVLFRIEDDLYRMMAVVGFAMQCPANTKAIEESDVEFLEKTMGAFEEEFKGLNEFIRPGSTDKAARLNLARAVCRRVERKMVSFHQEHHGESDALMIKYLNRLSDLLFVLTYVSEEG